MGMPPVESVTCGAADASMCGWLANAVPSCPQVEIEGDVLVSCALSPTGECIAFGGSGGYVHLWAASEDPTVAGMGQVLCLLLVAGAAGSAAAAAAAACGAAAQLPPLALLPGRQPLAGKRACRPCGLPACMCAFPQCTPHVPQVLPAPAPSTPLVSLSEEDCFSQAATFFSMDGSLLSDLEPGEVMAVGLPPRLVDPKLLSSLKQSEFVGYIQNPAYKR